MPRRAAASLDRRQLPRIARRGAALLSWYDGHRRSLPWRGTLDPYAIWVSEVLLQQTRVETALPYYERFIARFPTVEALAAADLEEVLALWSGLGYYQRARRLVTAARAVVEAGGFPRTAAALEALPGVGRYTAAAVASIAFGEPVSAVDGNAERVAARLLASRSRRRPAAVAKVLLDPRRPGDSNQALMELGALVCRPRRPRCPRCPLRAACRAAAGGQPERYPEPRRRPAIQTRQLQVALVERGTRVLLVRRAESEALLAGTWELPWAAGSRRGAAERLARRYGGRWQLEAASAGFTHTVTHRRLEVAVRHATLVADAVAEGLPARWVERAAIAEMAVSALVGKALAAAAARENPPALKPAPGSPARRRRPAGESRSASRRFPGAARR